MLIPNHYTHLKLVDIVVEGSGKMAKTEATSWDVLGWALDSPDSCLTPITLRGVLRKEPGHGYAILNTADKSHTSLYGKRYADYAEFVRPLYVEADRREKSGEGIERPALVAGSGRAVEASEPGAKGVDSPRGESAVLGGLSGGIIGGSPQPWK